MSTPHDESDLSRIYAQRFAANADYRRHVWRLLIDSFFQRYVQQDATILDLGCGYGEFINQVRGSRKYAMDLNPHAPLYLSDDVEFIHQDCAQPWSFADGSLDVVFTSNFFEHLPEKSALGKTLDHVSRALREGGRLIAMGPNAKLVRGAYWDFWDHHIPLTESSLSEALQHRGFRIALKRAAFLPYTMAGKRSVPTALIRLYLAIPWVWRFFGKQFLVVAVKDRSGPSRDATK
jgi:SAM-dependent methyltransferase